MNKLLPLGLCALALAQDVLAQAPTERTPVAGTPSQANPPTAVDRTSPASALSDLPERAAAVGYADLDALRALPWFEEVVRHQLRDMGVTHRGVHQTLTTLSHTHSAHASLVRSSGDVAVFATLVVHGEYTRNEVPQTVQAILPGILAGLWEQTTIDGLRAYDMGVAALIELTPNDWILARRLRGELPLPGRTPVEDLRRLVEVGRGLGLGAATGGLAYGVLDGADAMLPGSAPPVDLESIFHGPKEALASFVSEGDRLVVHWDTTLHHEADAVRWEEHYRRSIGGLATRLHVPEASVRFALTRTGARLVSRIEVDRVAADAFVAELVGRALPSAPGSATSGAGAATP